ncbi:MAG: plasmid mobilization relaxosome protein MobC [Bacteroidota bacterium]
MSQDDAPQRKSEKRQRTHFFGVRLSAEEAALFDRRRAEGGFASRADYFRAACLKQAPLRPRLDVQQLVRVEVALNRIGGNVNQIAANANRAGIVTPDELDELYDHLDEVHGLVEQLYPAR